MRDTSLPYKQEIPMRLTNDEVFLYLIIAYFLPQFTEDKLKSSVRVTKYVELSYPRCSISVESSELTNENAVI